MAGSFTGQMLSRALINGDLNAAQLESLVSSDKSAKGAMREHFKGNFNALLSSTSAMAAIFGATTLLPYVFEDGGQLLAANDTGTRLLAASPYACAAIMDEDDYFDLWLNSQENLARLRSNVNQSGSCLVRYTYTASDVLVMPNLIRMSYFLCGRGGDGGYDDSGPNVIGGGGGAGAESKWGVVDLADIPVPGSNLTITMPVVVAGNEVQPVDTQIGSLASAASGKNGRGFQWNNITTGSGATTGDARPTDLSVDIAVWNSKSGSRKGGDGGPGAQGSNSQPAADGTAGLTGAGGARAPSSSGADRAGRPGTGLCSGGGGGWAFSSGNVVGQNAAPTDYGSGGGGSSQGSAGQGGTGAPGLAAIYGALAAPAA